MDVILIRHSATAGNALRRYIGVTDEPLSPEGVALAEGTPSFPCDEVFVTPLLRTRQTAAILFPTARQRIVPDLREMDFGAFENRSAEEMEDDPAYRTWVDGMCLGPCPGGESRGEFSRRVCTAFQTVITEALAKGREQAVFVVHGGTVMAILEKFGRPAKDYYSYGLQNCRRYRCRLEAPSDGAPLPFVLTHLQLEG